jgi:fibronectin-binding autotransporter adhesin
MTGSDIDSRLATGVGTGGGSPRPRLAGIAVAALALVALQAGSVFAQSGTWTVNGTQSWPVTTNWTGGVVAGGTDATATFANTATATVSLPNNVVLGNLSTGSSRVTLRSGTETTNSLLTNEHIEFAKTAAPAPTITNTGRLDMFVVIAGTQGFTKSGGGQLWINRPNTYAGVTTITAGDVRLAQNNGLGDSSAGNGTVIESGAILRLDNTSTATSGGLPWITGVQTSEPFSIAGTGVSNLGALRSQAGTDNAFTGPITLAANSLVTANPGVGLTLGGPVDLGSHTLTLGDNGDFVVSGNVVGAGGSVVYNGTGSLTLSGNNSFGGTTTVSNTGGPVAMNGTLTGAMAFNGSSRTLIGTGTFAGGLSVGSTNVLSPGATGTAAGDSYGTITAGTLTVQSGTVRLGVQNTTTYDRLVMTAGSGGLTLGGTANLALDFAGALPTTSLDLMSFTGLSGNFQSVASTGFYTGTWTNSGGVWTLENVGTGGLQTLTYTQATGVLSVVPEPSAIALFGGGAMAAGLFRTLRRRAAGRPPEAAPRDA